MKIGEVMRRWRVMSERTLRSVAEEIGIEHSTLYRMENGLNVEGRSLAKVLAWLLSDVQDKQLVLANLEAEKND